MKKLFIILFIIIVGHQLSAQTTKQTWYKVAAVPETAVYSVDNANGSIYAGTTDKIYFSSDLVTWDSSQTLNPASGGVEDICYYDNSLFAATYGKGVFHSQDNGKTWTQQNIGLNSNYTIEFAIRNHTLYVATDDNAIFKYNSTTSSWSDFSQGLLFGTSYSFNALANTDSCLVGSVGANGVLVVRYDTSIEWGYSYPTGTLAPNLVIYDVLQAGPYIWALTGIQAFASNDQGKTWTHVNKGMRSGYTCRGIQIGDTLFATVTYAGDNAIVYKRSLNASLQDAWIVVDTLANYAALNLAHKDGRLYIATQRGLIYTELYGPTNITGVATQADNCLLFPNPASDHLTIRNGKHAGFENFMLYDARGKLLISSPLLHDEEIISVKHLPAGLYHYNLSHSFGKVKTGTIVITH